MLMHDLLLESGSEHSLDEVQLGLMIKCLVLVADSPASLELGADAHSKLSELRMHGHYQKTTKK